MRGVGIYKAFAFQMHINFKIDLPFIISDGIPISNSTTNQLFQIKPYGFKFITLPANCVKNLFKPNSNCTKCIFHLAQHG